MKKYNEEIFLIKLIQKKIQEDYSFDENKLLKLIKKHQITGRIKQLIKDNHYERYFSSKFLNNLENAYKNSIELANRNILALKEINETIEEKEKWPIVIKGFSNYLINDNITSIRSGDIDLIPENIENFIELLEENGFQLTKIPFLHEAGEYSKQKIEIDIHKYFPIYRYDENLPYSESVSLNKFYTMPFEKILQEDLVDSVYFSDKHKIRVVDPNFYILIICSHAFMNYTNIWSISHRENTYTKIGEIWDILDLLNSANYSQEKFLYLVEKYDAYDCVNWTGEILKAIFDYNPLSFIKNNRKSFAEYPKCLWWNFWINIESTPPELISENWYDFSSVLNLLGANQVINNKSYTTLNLNHVHTIGDISLEFEIIDNYLIIKNYKKYSQIRVDFGNRALEFSISDLEDGFQKSGNVDKITSFIKNNNLYINLVSDSILIGCLKKNNKINEMIFSITRASDKHKI